MSVFILALILSLPLVSATDVLLSEPVVDLKWSSLHTPLVRMIEVYEPINAASAMDYNPAVLMSSYSLDIRMTQTQGPFNEFQITIPRGLDRLPALAPMDEVTKQVVFLITNTSIYLSAPNIPPGAYETTLYLTPPTGLRLVYTINEFVVKGAGVGSTAAPVVVYPTDHTETGDIRRLLPIDLILPIPPSTGEVRIEITFTNPECVAEYVLPTQPRLRFSIPFDSSQQTALLLTSSGCDLSYGNTSMRIRYMTLINEWSAVAEVTNVRLTPAVSNGAYYTPRAPAPYNFPVSTLPNASVHRSNYSIIVVGSHVVIITATHPPVYNHVGSLGVSFSPLSVRIGEHNGYISLVLTGNAGAQWIGVAKLKPDMTLVLSTPESTALRFFLSSIFPFSQLAPGNSIAAFRASDSRIVVLAMNLGQFASVYIATDASGPILGVFTGIPRSFFVDGLPSLWITNSGEYDATSNTMVFASASPRHAYVAYNLTSNYLYYSPRRTQYSSCVTIHNAYVYVREVFEQRDGDVYSTIESIRRERFDTRTVFSEAMTSPFGIAAIRPITSGCWVRFLHDANRLVVATNNVVSIYDPLLSRDSMTLPTTATWITAQPNGENIVLRSSIAGTTLNQTRVPTTPTVSIGAASSSGTNLEVLIFERGVGANLILTITPIGSSTSYSFVVPIAGYTYASISELVATAIALNQNPFKVESLEGSTMRLMSVGGDLYSPTGYLNTSTTIDIEVDGVTLTSSTAYMLVTASLVNSSTCHYHGNDTIGHCSCEYGYYGYTCELTKDACTRLYANESIECNGTINGELIFSPSGTSYCPSMCSNHGVCVPYQGCVCIDGFFGNSCSVTADECRESACNGFPGECVYTINPGSAVCMVRSRDAISCGSHGTLRRIGSSRRLWCECESGFYGLWCDMDQAECTSTLCPGGSCEPPSDIGQVCTQVKTTSFIIWILISISIVCILIIFWLLFRFK